VAQKMARLFSLISLICLILPVIVALTPATRCCVAAPQGLDPAGQRDDRTVYLGCNLSDEDLLLFTNALAVGRHRGPVLLYSLTTRPHLKGFLDAFQPGRIVPVGCTPEQKTDVANALDHGLASSPEWDQHLQGAAWQASAGKAKYAVVCSAHERRLLLHAACLAGVLQAPLCLVREQENQPRELHDMLADGKIREIFAIGDEAARQCGKPRETHVVHLRTERDAIACYIKHQQRHGPIETVVLANPADIQKRPGAMSSLAPWIALQKRAALLLTNPAGNNSRALVTDALAYYGLDQVENLIVVADPTAIPPERRPNPVAGKDPAIEMEPMTPIGSEPFSFSTGRLFSADPGMVLLTLARQQLLASKTTPSKALVISNPAGGLPLLEAFSRHTAKELQNSGYQTTTLFGEEVRKDPVRQMLPQQDIFLWEGHHSTLTKDYGLPGWPEALQPSLVFLQSCLALCEEDAMPLLQRGAVGVIGSSTRTYSASGGACSLAFFDALLYEDQTIGSALRHSKNFLLAFTLLKEQRLGEDAKLRGANLRSAWAFTLWGDPTLRLPRQQRPADALAMVRHEVRGNTIILQSPDQAYEKITSSQYGARMLPNSRLAGLVRKGEVPSERQLASLLFAEISLPKAPAGQMPVLSSKLPGDRWVFCWDGRRQCGYLLVMPRAKEPGDLRFHVQWAPSVAKK